MHIFLALNNQHIFLALNNHLMHNTFMRIRKVNKLLLRKRIKEHGLEKLAVDSNCSASLLQKLASDSYEKAPSMRTVDGLCLATGDEMNVLFPVCEIEKEAS